ncbi:MAG: branched-chain amino acid transaminase [Chloroflexi bacterium]|nr:branched-chain amino acid transaminase [Chloroflexota bacterium]
MSQTRYAYFQGKIVPLEEAKISVVTHAFNYGTAVFEGIRAYWNEEQEQLYIFRLREHFERLVDSARIMRIDLRLSVDEMCRLAVEVTQKGRSREDTYIRPLAYKSSTYVGVRLHDLEDDFLIYTAPLGVYIDIEKAIRARVSSWRRLDDNMIPARSKVTGAYANSALSKTEAALDGYDEAIVLTSDGHVSEGSAENLFVVRKGRLITPPVTENILEGITRNTSMELAREELGVEAGERQIDRTELYVADECFLCGTGAQVSAIGEIDRRKVGSGEVGPITRQLQKLYFDIVRGKVEKYRKWCTPVY